MTAIGEEGDGALLDYSVSDDAMRWSPEPEKAKPPTGLLIRGELVYAAPRSEQLDVFMRSFAEASQQAALRLGQSLRRIGEEMNRVKPLLEEAELIPVNPPTDVRANALWLRQRRNTGPSRDVVHQRRPRRTT